MPQTIRLNGSNYVSEKTRSAFENALKEDQPVVPPPGSAHSGGGNGNGSDHGHQHGAAAPAAADTVESRYDGAASTEGYASLLESLEKSLARSYEDHAQTVRVHEQYLDHQSDYTTLVEQLLQQQRDIFAQGLANPQMAELAGRVLESLAQSMARFHELQAQTLSVHKQFLEQQAQYSQAQTDLIHLAVPSGGSGTAAPSSTPAADRIAAPPAAVKPGSGNGHGHHSNGHNGNGHGSVTASSHAQAARPEPLPSHKPAAQVSPTPPSARIADAAGRPVASAPEPRHPAAPPATPSAPPPSPEPAALAQSLISIVSDKTGYPADMLDLSMDMEADLGIDSIKRVEILGAMQERHPDLPKVEPHALAELRTLGQIVEHMQAVAKAEPQPQVNTLPIQPPAVMPVVSQPPAAQPDSASLTQSLLAVVSDKTGYPADMLDLSMDMEADLGIDSIKRVEIMGAVQERHPDLPKADPQALAELRTLQQIVDCLRSEPDPKKA